MSTFTAAVFHVTSPHAPHHTVNLGNFAGKIFARESRGNFDCAKLTSLMISSVPIRYEKRSANITVHGEDTVTDVIIAGCNALGVPFDANMGLETRTTGQWRFVRTQQHVKDIKWTRAGFLIWRSKFPLQVKIHNVMVYEGSWDAQARNIQAGTQYTVEKALRIGGVKCDSQNIFTDDKRAVTMTSPISDFTAILLKPDMRVISPSAQDTLTQLSVVYNGKEEHLAVSSRYSVVDLPFMLGVDEPADKVCVCRKVRIVNDYVSVALYAGEEIEIQSLSNYL